MKWLRKELNKRFFLYMDLYLKQFFFFIVTVFVVVFVFICFFVFFFVVKRCSWLSAKSFSLHITLRINWTWCMRSIEVKMKKSRTTNNNWKLLRFALFKTHAIRQSVEERERDLYNSIGCYPSRAVQTTRKRIVSAEYAMNDHKSCMQN